MNAGDVPYALDGNTIAALGKPSVDSFMTMGTAGVPIWFDVSRVKGILHTKGKAMTNSIRTTTSTTYVAVQSSFKFDLVLAVPCTVIAWAHGVAHKDAGTHTGSFALSINGVTDPDVDNMQVISTAPTPFSTMYYANGIAAGTRTVRLMMKTANAGDAVFQDSCAIHAIAITE